MQQLAAEGLPMVEVPQTNARMVPASGYLYELITDGVLAHNGDATFAQHMRKVVAMHLCAGISTYKELPSKTPRITSFAAAILAYLFDDREDEGSDSFGFIDMDGDDA